MGTEELRWDFRQDCERPLGHWFSFVNPRDKLWYGDKHIESSSRWYNVVAGRDDSCDRFDAHLKRIQEGDRKKIQPIATAGWFLCRQLAMISSPIDKILVVLRCAHQREPTSLARSLGFNLEVRKSLRRTLRGPLSCILRQIMMLQQLNESYDKR